MSQTLRCVQPLSELLLRFEGERLTPYRCSAGVPTIGVGATTYPDGRKVSMKDPAITVEQSRQMLAEECQRYLSAVSDMLTWEATDDQLVAMASLAYNIGLQGFRKSTVLRAHNAGNHAAAARAFGLWNKARVNGVLTELRGLTARRAAESALYLRTDSSAFSEPSIQAVESETKLAKSPITLAGASSVAVGGTALTSQLVQDTLPLVSQVQQTMSAFNINPTIVLGLVAVGVGVIVWKWRKAQRDGGWA